MKRSVLSVLIGAVVMSSLAGCASKKDQEIIVYTERTLIFEEDNRRYIHSVATTEYGNQGLGGAAVLQPDNIHVMADERRTGEPKFDDQTNSSSSSVSSGMAERRNLKNALASLEASKAGGSSEEIARKLSEAMTTMATIQAHDSNAQLSHYDLELWDKFCSGGDDMTDDDWGQMLSSSTDQIPDSIAEDCNEPDLTITDETTTAYCAGETLPNRDQFILQEHTEEIQCE